MLWRLISSKILKEKNVAQLAGSLFTTEIVIIISKFSVLPHVIS